MEIMIASEDIVFTIEKHGEYGFYTRFSPIPEYPGIYRVFTETTCAEVACETVYQGIRALTTREYRRMKKASDKAEAVGSLY